MIERYFHIRPPVHPIPFHRYENPTASRGGATVRVTGDIGEDSQTLAGVTVQVAFCSNKDAFCRATGRLTATRHPMKLLSLTDLPAELQNISREVTKRVLKLSRTRRQQHPLWDADYSFSTKYFQPKKVST